MSDIHEAQTDRRCRETNESVSFKPRQIILMGALQRHFFAHGYKSSTMDQLAREMRCSKRALYDLAPTRPALFLAIVERWAARVRMLGQQGEAGQSDPKRKLAAYLEPGVTETRGMTTNFLADLRDLPDARAVLEAHQRERMSHLKDILAAGAKAGAFKKIHAHLVAGICLAGIEKINEPAFLEQAELSFSEAFAELYRLLLQGLERE